MDSSPPHNAWARLPLVAAALLGAAGVALGAFGAHALKPTLEARDMLYAWETAVQYQFYHALALLALAALPVAHSRRLLTATALAWIIGVILFSGSLYLMALGGPRWLGPITPLGGLAFLLGWSLLAYHGLRKIQA